MRAFSEAFALGMDSTSSFSSTKSALEDGALLLEVDFKPLEDKEGREEKKELLEEDKPREKRN